VAQSGRFDYDYGLCFKSSEKLNAVFTTFTSALAEKSEEKGKMPQNKVN
jgi:hypothetical protein